jgi:hypothetical protein
MHVFSKVRLYTAVGVLQFNNVFDSTFRVGTPIVNSLSSRREIRDDLMSELIVSGPHGISQFSNPPISVHQPILQCINVLLSSSQGILRPLHAPTSWLFQLRRQIPKP